MCCSHSHSTTYFYHSIFFFSISFSPTPHPRLLLERGASTTLPDSNGRLLSCTAFAGTQFLLETHRKQRCRSIIDNLRSHRPLKEFRRCWQGPSDFNLYASNGDNMLMLAAQHAQQEVLKFLLEQAAAMKPTMIISSGESPLLLRYILYSCPNARGRDHGVFFWLCIIFVCLLFV